MCTRAPTVACTHCKLAVTTMAHGSGSGHACCHAHVPLPLYATHRYRPQPKAHSVKPAVRGRLTFTAGLSNTALYGEPPTAVGIAPRSPCPVPLPLAAHTACCPTCRTPYVVRALAPCLQMYPAPPARALHRLLSTIKGYQGLNLTTCPCPSRNHNRSRTLPHRTCHARWQQPPKPPMRHDALTYPLLPGPAQASSSPLPHAIPFRCNRRDDRVAHSPALSPFRLLPRPASSFRPLRFR